MHLEDKIVKEFAEWANKTQCGYGEDEADIWFEDLPHYDALEWKVREIVRTLLAQKDAEVSDARREELHLFKDTMQERANTIPPNLLLNEIVNYTFDRLKVITPPDQTDKYTGLPENSIGDGTNDT